MDICVSMFLMTISHAMISAMVELLILYCFYAYYNMLRQMFNVIFAAISGILIWEFGFILHLKVDYVEPSEVLLTL